MISRGQRDLDRAVELAAAEAAARVAAIRARLPTGPGREDCSVCGDEIPPERRAALPGIQTCVDCAARAERRR